jgi:uncharacterized protein HemX
MKISVRSVAVSSLVAATLGLALVVPARAQSQDQAQAKVQSQAKDPAAAKASSTGAEQAAAQSGAQKQAPQTDSLADAARKAREKKGKQDGPKVLTEDDMSKLSGHGVSVVGDADSGSSAAANSGSTPRDQQEAYWRSRAQALLSQMAAVDQRIDKVKEDIRKYGTGGFDPATGLTQNVIYFQDRQAELDRLEKQRRDLDKQMDELQEEGRKAGASPSLFR